MIAKARRYFATVRHLGARQLATRALRIVERLSWRLTRAEAPLQRAPALRAHTPLWRDLPEDEHAIANAEEVVNGRVTFLGVTRPWRGWNAEGATHLWRFHLHYFDVLRDLATFALYRDRGAAYRTFRDLVGTWIDAHRALSADAWHPYPISLRVVNWCESAVLFRPELERDAAFAATLYESLASQAQFLSRHVEHDVRGNHLLENARALIRASAFFERDDWRRRALAILAREIPEQILPDGGHFERAPGYHVRVLEVLQDIAALHPLPLLDDAIARMRDFLAVIVPPNGRLPLLKDTTLPEQPLRLDSRPSRWLDASGFAVVRDDARGDHLIADFGRVCPDYLPAHAHADLFSFELTIGGLPVIVDSGVYAYEAGEWRTWFRSTPAHNTVALDGRDQSEMWGSFRVGRRARPFDVRWEATPDNTVISGFHDGYAPWTHERRIEVWRATREWLVLDRIRGAAGFTARSYVHLHPDAPSVTIEPIGDVRLEEGEGWYSERFGEKRRNRVLTLVTRTGDWFGYRVGAEPPRR